MLRLVPRRGGPSFALALAAAVALLSAVHAAAQAGPRGFNDAARRWLDAVEVVATGTNEDVAELEAAEAELAASNESDDDYLPPGQDGQPDAIDALLSSRDAAELRVAARRLTEHVQAFRERTRAARGSGGRSGAQAADKDEMADQVDASLALFHLASLAQCGIRSVANVDAEALLAEAKTLAGFEATLALAEIRLARLGVYESNRRCSAHLAGDVREVAYAVLRDTHKTKEYFFPHDAIRLRERSRDGDVRAAEAAVAASEHDAELAEELGGTGLHEAMDGSLGTFSGETGTLPQPADVDLEEAVRGYIQGAMVGDPVALYAMGYLHLKGIGMPKNETMARHFFVDAHKNGVPGAATALGVMHVRGAGGARRDLASARSLFTDAAAAGELEASYNLGVLKAAAQDPLGALYDLTVAHDGGYWRAPLALADLHIEHAGIPGSPEGLGDCARAHQLLRTFLGERLGWAALQDDALDALEEGEVPGAFATYCAVAAQGSAVGALNAGWLAWKTRTSRDPLWPLLSEDGSPSAAALTLLRRAAARNAQDAHVDAGLLLLEHPSLATGAPAEEALASFRAGASAGVAEAHFYVGKALMTGHGTGRNLTAALGSFQTAARTAMTGADAVAPTLMVAIVQAALMVQSASTLLGTASVATGFAVALGATLLVVRVAR